MRIIALLAVPLLLAARPARAAFGSDTGVAGAQFLRVGAGARSLGMGEAMTACAEGPEAQYWNPAGLAASRSLEVSYARAELPAQVHHDYAAVAWPMAWSGGTWGFAMTRLSQGGIDQLDNVGQSQGSFSPHSEAYSLAYSRAFTEDDNPTQDRGYFRDTWNMPGTFHPFNEEREPWTGSFRAGLAVKAVSETIGRRTAGTAAADGGVSYRPSTRPALSLAWAFRNAGGKLRYIQDSEPLPFEFALGAAHDWEPERAHVLTAIEAAFPIHQRPYGKLGVEWDHSLSKGVSAIWRAGYNSRTAPDLGALTGLTVGVGAKIGGFSCDLAFQPMGQLGEAFRLGIGWKFGRASEY